MKLLARDIDRFGAGSVKLVAEDAEDMWNVYNIVTQGDFLRAPTIRKVQRTSVTGSSEAEKMKITLGIQVQSTEFDPASCALRVTGQNVQESEWVKIGAFHTIELEPNRAFTLGKQWWDTISLERVEEACNPARGADAAALIMQEGLAHLCLLCPSMTITRARIEVNIPRKGKNALYNRDKALERFFDATMRAILNHIELEEIKAFIIASPGFLKDSFFKYFMNEAVRQGIKKVVEKRSIFVLAHSSSGHKQDLNEVLSSPSLSARLEQTKAVGETRALQSFFDMINMDPSRAVYGVSHVFHAHELQAIQVLLLMDTLFRSEDLDERKKYSQLVDDVKGSGGQHFVFSSLNVAGEQLKYMGGLAALLRFPIPDLDELELE
ncbi:Protein pelota-like [Porphyridium purpureum]|uniref:Protein pelota homolog n=1 Tax=Porphyridium purpureum TaxID=35688 RepID=A0A5J4Z8Z0_PORPP|nr:Protein pelota-like [Porphyridium purpureum]|eukprot:POR0745..scf295_1